MPVIAVLNVTCEDAAEQVASVTLGELVLNASVDIAAKTVTPGSDKGKIECRLTSTTPSVKLSREHVVVDGTKDEVVYVSIDWDHVPIGEAATSFSISSSGMEPVKITVKTVKADASKLPEKEFYGSLSDAFVIPASGFNSKQDVNGVAWQKVSGLGRWGFNSNGAMAVFPQPTPSVLPPSAAPTLEYSVFIPEPGKVTINVEIMPIFPDNPTAGTLNIRELRLGTTFDDEPVKITDTLSREFKRLNNEANASCSTPNVSEGVILAHL